MQLHNKVSLITGAGSGIGRATAELFSREGSRLFCVDIDERAVQETVCHLPGTEAVAHGADVSCSEEVQAMVKVCLDRFGRIDVLCNNAGIGSTQTVVDTPDDVWDRVFAVNVRGVFLCCKHVIPHMLSAEEGVIVNTASVAGLVGLRNRAAYCASKAAVINLTRSIALDYVRQGIRCNCVCPGTIDSPWVQRLLNGAADPVTERAALVARQPMGRLGRPEEVAQAILYLASEQSAFATGSPLIIDGGLTAQ